MKEASISTDTLALAAPRLSTMICSHFSQGGESRARLQFTFPTQVMILWKDWGSVMEPSTTRTAHAFCSLVTQLRSSNCIPAACLGTKTLQEEGSAICRACALNTRQPGPTTVPRVLWQELDYPGRSCENPSKGKHLKELKFLQLNL